MADIFISYAREDVDTAQRLAQALGACGWSVWWDRRIPTGRRFHEIIERELTAAGCVIPLWSKAAIASSWVREEAQDGLDRGVIVPAMIEAVPLPLGFRTVQTVDLSRWQGDGDGCGLTQLVEDIEELLGPAPRRLADEKRREAEEARRRAEEEEQRRSEAEAKRQTEERERRRGEEEAERKAEEERQRAAADAKRQAEEEAQRRAVEEARRKAEDEQTRREKEEAEAKRQAEEEARRRAETEAKRKAEEEERERQWRARRSAEVKRQAEEEAKRRGEGQEPKPGLPKWIIGAAAVLVVGLGAISVKFFPDGTTVPFVTTERERPVTPSPPAEAPKTPAPETTKKTTADTAKPAPDVAKTTKSPPRSFRDCDICPSMVALPGGTLLMGSPESEEDRDRDEVPQHEVALKRFAIGRYEVTFDEWDACVAGGGCGDYRPDDEGWGRGKRPVINVSWEDAIEYADWLAKKTGKPYRLPTEAEWEYATRAGTTTPFAFGTTITTDQANYNGTSTYAGGPKGVYRKQTVPVGSFPPNPWGLYDMHGNAWEWVEDCWHTYQGAPADASAWVQGQCAYRVGRGGSWLDDPAFLRSAFRGGGVPYPNFRGGFWRKWLG